MSKRTFRTALIVVVATVAMAGGVIAYVVNAALDYPDRRHAGKGVEVEVEIKSGLSFPRIAALLSDKHVISKPRWFRLLAMHRGLTTKVRPGKYVLRDDMTPSEVLDEIVKGVEEVQVAVTLQPGLHMLEYFDELAAPHDKDGKAHPELAVASAEALEALARDPAFLKAHGIDGESVDGYLYPDSYQFVVPTKPEKVLERLINQHRSVWNKLVDKHRKAYGKLVDKLKWSDRDILVMASIVQKEAGNQGEMPNIASVFINRLSMSSFKPKLLQTDPTIRYGCQVPVQKSAACKAWDVTDRLHQAQLDDEDNPYNTYQHEGLPPGPIANPGSDAIAAVLAPADTDYLYFVADSSHVTHFAKSRAEHERNVDKYILGK